MPGTNARRLRRSLWAIVLGLTLWPVSTWAEEQEPAAGDAGAAIEAEAEFEAESAGEASAPPAGVEVIRIKGRAVTAIETEVPTSVTQFDAAAIEALGAQNISDLARVTPNVEIKVAGATAPTFFIRGVGLSDFNANAAGAVSVYQDDVAINAPAIQLGLLYDLENVVVLRGPQGGGSGRNASAGAIKVYSRKPTGERSAEFRSTWGRFNAMDFEGALEIPIVEEMLASRFAFRYLERDPYAKNGCSGGPSLEDKGVALVPNPFTGIPEFKVVDIVKAEASRNNTFCGEKLTGLTPVGGGPSIRLSTHPGGLPGKVNDAGNWAARGQLRFQPPGTDMDWLLNAHGSRLDQQSTFGQAIGTANDFFGGATSSGYRDPDIGEMQNDLFEELGEQFPDLDAAELGDLVRKELTDELARNLDIRPYRGDYNRVGQTQLDTWGGFLRGEWSIGAVDFTSITGYDTYERSRDQDQDFTPDVLFEAVSSDEAWQFSQELRLGGELRDAPFRWEVGGYYLMEELDSSTRSFLALPFQDSIRDYEQDLWSFAFFGDFSWDFLDDFTLEGGVRYNWEQKDFDHTLSFPNRFLLVGGEIGPFPPQRTVTGEIWQAPTGTISLTYRFNEDVSVYWKYSRGWKGGHFNASAVLQRDVVAVDPETIDAFEVGLRGRWLDGRLGIGASLFYYHYADYQVFIVEDEVGAPPTFNIVNANDAEVYGGELEVRAEPIDGLVLSGRMGWLESQFLDFTNETFRSLLVFDANGRAISVPLPITVDFTGNRLINSPQFKASFAAEWTLDLGRWGALVPRYDFAWSDDIFFDPSEGRGSLNARGETVLPDFAVGQRAFWLHNAQLAYRTPEGNIEVTGWVRNFTDQVYKTYAFDASTFSDIVINFVGQPRTYGVTFSVAW